MSFSQKQAVCFAGYLMISMLVAFNFAGAAFGAPSQTSSNLVLADDTLLVQLAPHADRAKIEALLQSGAQSATIEDMHVNGDDYSILHVAPTAGQRESAINKIGALMKQHSEITSVDRNYLCHPFEESRINSAPNDPDFSQQWPLAVMRWPAARSKYGNSQVRSAYITILSGGVTPVTTENELGAYVNQYNATVSPIVKEAVQGFGPEGDIDTSISGCLTDNDTLIAGAACFSERHPCHITMLRVTSGGGVSDAIIEAGLVWSINNQTARGGPGPVNVSYGHGFPGAPLWNKPDIQTMAKSLLKHGDILVLAAGDKPGTYTTYPPGSVAVIQGTNQNNQFDSGYLTLVQNDPAGAPGAAQPAIINGIFNDNHFGSSFSAPLWSAAIAMLISINPHLTSADANQILIQTGTPISGAAWTAVVPAFDNAILAAKKH